ncbi:DNA polymerase III subunit alpha [Oenococcus sp.]|uniref:DNA polymerase III subunit alpha n=1 Tax=Oenococcus sp. TaxID=1979414 RepID=UPI0039EA4A03
MAAIVMSNPYPNYDPRIRDQFIRNYRDRGMMKWGGFYLSDHTRVIEKKAKSRRANEKRRLQKQMDFQKISANLFSAFANEKEVSVQLAEENKDHYAAQTIVGFVQGYGDDGVVIAGQVVAYDDIWNCSIIN